MSRFDADPLDERLVRSLRDRLSRRGRRDVDLHETPLSWVLLAGPLALKIKKPVRVPFVDFTSVAARRRNCAEELRLNRRLAPTLYRAVLEVRGTADAPRFRGEGPTIDAILCMRRFPERALLSERLAGGALEPRHVDALASCIAAFHDDAEIVRDVDPEETTFAALESVLSQLARHAAPGWCVRASHWAAASRGTLAPLMRRRRDEGFVRDVHGDLHLANTLALGDEATAFDCLEFDASLRRIDLLSDVAFLTMDLRAHGRGDLAWRFLDRYLAERGDFGGLPLLRFFEASRACVRALVGTMSPLDTAAGPNYLGLASVLMEPRHRTPKLAIMHGLSGSGKSTLAARIVEHAGLVRVRSDRERKRIAGVPPLDHDGGARDLYRPESDDATYARLRECARESLRAGYDTLIDATFLSGDRRRDFARLAEAHGADFAIIACEAPDGLLRSRLAERASHGRDLSDATVGTLDLQLARQEPLTRAEGACTLRVDTSDAVDVAALVSRWHAASLDGMASREEEGLPVRA